MSEPIADSARPAAGVPAGYPRVPIAWLWALAAGRAVKSPGVPTTGSGCSPSAVLNPGLIRPRRPARRPGSLPPFCRRPDLPLSTYHQHGYAL